jgi:hypothetical protein
LTDDPVQAAGNGVLAYYAILGSTGRFELPEEGDLRHLIRAVWHLPACPADLAFHPEELLQVLPEYVREPDADQTVLLRKKEPWQ